VKRAPAIEHQSGHQQTIRMKKIGFLSFGHWTPSSQSQTRSAADTLLQSIELAVAAEELGADGAYFRVHHFARQLASPFPLLAAIGAKTSRIEIGTAVIDMRYENPLYMAEDAGAADLIAGGRLQLGISRGSPEQVIDGWRHFGFVPPAGMSDADMARRHTEVFLEVRVDNERAQRLYRSRGFAEIGIRRGYYQPSGTDALVMQLSLPRTRRFGFAGPRRRDPTSDPRTDPKPDPSPAAGGPR